MPALDPISRDVYSDILAEFPALEQARDRKQVAAAVREAAPAWLPATDKLHVELSKLYVKPQKHVRILFHFFGDNAAGATEHTWAVGIVPHKDTLEKIQRKAAKGKAKNNNSNKNDRAKALPLWEHGLELEPFTTDADLAHVAKLTDAGWAKRYFQALVERLPLPAGTNIDSVDIDPFKYLPGKRIVLRYRLRYGDDELLLFAKHYDSDQGRASADIQNHVSRHLDSASDLAIVPRVYHSDPELQVTFQQAWEGATIEKGESDQPRQIWPRLLRATRALHAVPVPRSNHATLDARALLFKIRKDVADVTALLPQLKSLMESSQQTLTRTLERETAQRTGFLHGSLLPSQILLGENTVAFLDFDGTAEGDPLYDICELLTSFLFEDWRFGRSAQEIRASWKHALADYEQVYEIDASYALASAYTLTFLMNRTHQHLKKLRAFPASGLEGLTDLLQVFLAEQS